MDSSSDPNDAAPSSLRLLEQAAAAALVLVPLAYVAGYLAWLNASRRMGLRFQALDPATAAAFGALALALTAVYIASWKLGQLVEDRRRRDEETRPFEWGLIAAGVFGVALSLALIYFIDVGMLDAELAVAVATMGAVVPVGSTLFLAWQDRGVPRDPSSRRPGLPFIALVAFLSAASVVGVAIAPSVPLGAGGFEPSPAILVAPEANLPSALAATYNGNQSGTMNAVVWVFATNGGFLVRPACEPRASGPAFWIPSNGVQSVQWITEPSRRELCSQAR